MADAGSLTGRLRSTWRLFAKELSAFGVVGICCFFLDVGLFQLLYGGLGVGAILAKFTSTVVSMTVAYFAHRYWSFSHRARTGLRREYLLFAVVNVAIYVFVGVTAIVSRVTDRGVRRPFRMPLFPLPPLLAIVGAVLALSQQSGRDLIIVAVIYAAGLAYYLLYLRSKSSAMRALRAAGGTE